MQADLDKYLVGYNTKRPHQGRCINGRTALAAFREGLPRSQEGGKIKTEKPPKQIAA
jgi:hypothetical protein